MKNLYFLNYFFNIQLFKIFKYRLKIKKQNIMKKIFHYFDFYNVYTWLKKRGLNNFEKIELKY